MKVPCIIVVALFFATIQSNIHAQESTDKRQISNDLLEKSKRQKTTAWILMGTGSAAFIYGLSGFSRGFVDFASDEKVHHSFMELH